MINNIAITHCESLPNAKNGPQLFRILQVNVHSIRNKHLQMETEVVSNEYPEMIVVSETWLTDEIKNHFDITGYSFLSHN